MVATKRSNNSRLVGKDDLVVGVGREQALEEGDSGVEDDSAFNTSLHANLNFAVVDKVGANTLDVRG